jgi:hypothetical protein
MEVSLIYMTSAPLQQRYLSTVLLAVVQDTAISFGFNGESDLDLQYAMGLVAPQPVTLLQTGDLSQGQLNPTYAKAHYSSHD